MPNEFVNFEKGNEFMARKVEYALDELADFLSPESFKGFAFDSREVTSGSLFFALKGEQSDGHDFLKEVAMKGAKAAVVSSDYRGESYGLKLYFCESPKKMLQLMAKLRLKRLGAPIVAVTGSLGKTTTKGFLQVLLEKKYRLFATPGNQNSQVGFPLAVLNHLKGDEQLVIAEMGMSFPGEISRLVEIAPPDIALLTHVDLVHAANFHSLEGIAQAKAEIFLHPSTKVGFIPKEVACLELIASAGSCSKTFYSLNSPEGHQLISHPMISLPGRHNYHNLLGALSVARFLGMSEEELEERFPLLRLPERRFERCVKGGVTFINDSYNAAAFSVKAALESLPAPQPGGRTFAVLGEMLELGEFSEQCHRDVGECALNTVDAVYLLGDGCVPILECWRAAGRPAFLYHDQESLVADLKRVLQSGDVALVKGSRAKKMWEVIEKV